MEFSGSDPNISTFTTADQLHVAKKQDKAVQKKSLETLSRYRYRCSDTGKCQNVKLKEENGELCH